GRLHLASTRERAVRGAVFHRVPSDPVLPRRGQRNADDGGLVETDDAAQGSEDRLRPGDEGAPARGSLMRSMRLRRAAGMTLVELLVAFIVFLMLVGMLVTLSNTSLRTWESGESRKDMMDRAQRVLRQLSEDL